MADDYTPQQIKHLMDTGNLTDADVNQLHPAELEAYKFFKAQQPAAQTPEDPHKGLYKAAGAAAGMALPGLMAPEIAVPMWLMEILGGGAGSYLGGKMGNSHTPVLDTAEGAAPGALGPALHGLGSLIDGVGPMGRMIGGYAAGTAVGHPYIGAGIGRAAGKLGEGLETAGDAISGAMPGSLVRRGMNAMRGPASGAEVPLPRPNATGEAFTPPTATKFGPQGDPVIRPGSSSDTPFWQRQPDPGNMGRQSPADPYHATDMDTPSTAPDKGVGIERKPGAGPDPANLERARADFSGSPGNSADVPHLGVKIDMQGPGPNVTRKPMGAKGTKFTETNGGADSLDTLLSGIHGHDIDLPPNGGSGDPLKAEFPPGTGPYSSPSQFKAAGDAAANAAEDPLKLASIRAMIASLLGKKP